MVNDSLYTRAWSEALKEADYIVGRYGRGFERRPNKFDIAGKIFFDILARDRESASAVLLADALSKLQPKVIVQQSSTVPVVPPVKTERELIEEQIAALKEKLDDS